MTPKDTRRSFRESLRAAVLRVYHATLALLGLDRSVRKESDLAPLEDPDKAPLAERITEVYWRRVRDTGLGEEQARAMRTELRLRVAGCVNHFQTTALEEVAELERTLERYDRLREAAGINRRLLEEPSSPGSFPIRRPFFSRGY